MVRFCYLLREYKKSPPNSANRRAGGDFLSHHLNKRSRIILLDLSKISLRIGFRLKRPHLYIIQLVSRRLGRCAIRLHHCLKLVPLGTDKHRAALVPVIKLVKFVYSALFAVADILPVVVGVQLRALMSFSSPEPSIMHSIDIVS